MIRTYNKLSFNFKGGGNASRWQRVDETWSLTLREGDKSQEETYCRVPLLPREPGVAKFTETEENGGYQGVVEDIAVSQSLGFARWLPKIRGCDGCTELYNLKIVNMVSGCAYFTTFLNIIFWFFENFIYTVYFGHSLPLHWLPASCPFLKQRLKTHWVHFLLSIYTWVWAHPLEHGLPTRPQL